MTDNRDKMDADGIQPEETLVEDNEAIEAEVESWQDELPPEDDYQDHAEVLEEVLDEHQNEDLVQAQAEERAKRGKTILFVSIALGLLFIGGLAYLQFAPSDEPTGQGGALPVSSVMNVRELKEKKPAPVPAKPAEELQPATASPVNKEPLNMAHLYDPDGSMTGTKTALPTTVSPDLMAEKPLDVVSSEILTSSTTSTTPPPTTTPTLPQIAKVETIPVKINKNEPPALPAAPAAAPVVAPTAAPAPVAPVAPVAEQDERIKGLTAQVETLKASLEKMTRKNEELLAEIEQMTVSPVLTEREKDLEAKVQRLEKQLAEGKDGAVKQAAAEPKKAQPKKVASAPKKTTKKEPVAPKEDTGWVLRSATPDAAWVSAGPNSYELRRLAVGDELPDLGKVKEIREKAGRWEVVTDKKVLK